jgi:hypothetical protein
MVYNKWYDVRVWCNYKWGIVCVYGVSSHAKRFKRCSLYAVIGELYLINNLIKEHQ